MIIFMPQLFHKLFHKSNDKKDGTPWSKKNHLGYAENLLP